MKKRLLTYALILSTLLGIGCLPEEAAYINNPITSGTPGYSADTPIYIMDGGEITIGVIDNWLPDDTPVIFGTDNDTEMYFDSASGRFILEGVQVYIVDGLTDGTATLAAGELTGATLNNLIAKGTWTADGTWAIPAVTLGGTVSTNSKHFNVSSSSFYIDTTSGWSGLVITSTQETSSPASIYMFTNSVSPAIGDKVFAGIGRGKNDNSQTVDYGSFQFAILDETDDEEDGKFELVLIHDGTNNTVMTINSAGVLAVDDSYDTFDEYDDAELLREGVSKGNRELLKQAGVLTPKLNMDGEIIEGQYQIQLQSIVKLLAGGVYQNRDYIESLEQRIADLEAKLDTATVSK